VADTFGQRQLAAAAGVSLSELSAVLLDVRLRCRLTGLRRFARRAGVDPANLNGVLKGRTRPSLLMLAKLQALLAEES